MSELLPQVSCNASDIDCLCTDKNFVSGFSTCVEANCTVRDLLATTNVSSFACHHPVRNDSRTIATLAPTMAAFAVAFIVIRLVARWSMLGWDDASIILGFATSLVVSVLNTLSTLCKKISGSIANSIQCHFMDLARTSGLYPSMTYHTCFSCSIFQIRSTRPRSTSQRSACVCSS